MPEDHPSKDHLRRFLEGALPADEVRRIVRHLLRGCIRCRSAVERVAARLKAETSPSDDHPASSRYERVFERLKHRLSERRKTHRSQRLAAPALLEELLAEEPEGRLTLALRDRRFVSLPLIEELIVASRDRLFDSPQDSMEYAELAVAVSGRLKPATYGRSITADLASRAWACLANARRVAGDLPSAERAFHWAESLLGDGSGDPLEQAQFLSLMASLRSDQGRFADSDALLSEAAEIFRESGDRAGWGKVLIQRGLVAGHREDLDTAVHHLREGVNLVDPQEDPRMALCALHNLIWFLGSSGRGGEALLYLQKVRPTYETLGDRLNLLRLRWLEGRIARQLGQLDQAESVLLEVRQSWQNDDPGHEVALATLDLAMVYAAQGRPDPMRRLAQEMYPVFLAQDMRKEAIAALIVFQQAADRGVVTMGLVREIARFVERLAAG